MKKKPKKFFDSFMKFLVFFIVIHGVLMITWTYILATISILNGISMGNIAEDLSKTIVTEIVAPIVVYGITKCIENVSKYNDWVQKFSENKYVECDDRVKGEEDE